MTTAWQQRASNEREKTTAAGLFNLLPAMLLCPPPRSSAGTRSTHAATRKFVEKSTLRFIQGDWIGLFNEAVERAKTAKQKLVDRATAVLEKQERLVDLRRVVRENARIRSTVPIIRWSINELKRELVERGVVQSVLHSSIHNADHTALVEKVKVAVAETPDIDIEDRVFEYMIAEQAAARHRENWENTRIINELLISTGGEPSQRSGQLSQAITTFTETRMMQHFFDTGALAPPSLLQPCDDDEYIGAALGFSQELARYAVGRACENDTASIELCRNLIMQVRRRRGMSL